MIKANLWDLLLDSHVAKCVDKFYATLVMTNEKIQETTKFMYCMVMWSTDAHFDFVARTFII